MSVESIRIATWQLVAQAPILLVYLATLVLAFVYMRRAPLASALALAGAVILLASTLVVTFMQGGLARQGAPNIRLMMGYVYLGSSVVRAAGLALIVAAVFVGRGPTPTGTEAR